jgi:hypothetical protein
VLPRRPKKPKKGTKNVKGPRQIYIEIMSDLTTEKAEV